VLLTALMLLTGCSKPYGDLAELDLSDIPFDNPAVQSTDARVTSVDTSLRCPDGEPARVSAVVREGWDTPRPTVVLLHSGAFDYVLEPDPDDPLAGPSYHSDGRLERAWSVAKVWETLGINLRAVDRDEDNTGILAATLVDRDVAVVVPANCWGDLWHNVAGEVENDSEAEFLTRDGLGLASATVQSLVDADRVLETGIQFPVQVDPDNLILVGLGEGGRGVAELLHREDTPTVAAALVDSSPDSLAVWAGAPLDFPDEHTGLERIFGIGNLEAVDDTSLVAAVAAGAAPPRTGVLWSSLDPRIPAEMVAVAGAAVSDLADAWVVDTERPEHIQLASDPELSEAAAAWMLGEAPEAEADE